MKKEYAAGIFEKVRAELDELDSNLVDVDGKKLRPSQCYRFEMDPLHVLFNTNCPEGLKEKIQAIISKYLNSNESQPYQ